MTTLERTALSLRLIDMVEELSHTELQQLVGLPIAAA